MNESIESNDVPRGGSLLASVATPLALLAVGLFLSGCALLREAESVAALPTLDGKSCRLQGDCGGRLNCESRTVVFEGRVDATSVLERRTNPLATQDGFTLEAEDGRAEMVVRVDVADQAARAAVLAMARSAAGSRKRVSVRGEAIGTDSPIGACVRTLSIKLTSSDAMSVR
jgi:hypothetical protein